MRNPIVLSALVLLGATAACGGKSSGRDEPERVEQPSGPADAVLWIADGAFGFDFLGLRLGEGRTFPFGKTSGVFTWSPDRRRMFVEEPASEFAIFTVDGTRRPLNLAQGYSFSWSPDGQRTAMAFGGQVAIADADGQDPTTLPFDATDLSTFTVWSPDGSMVTFSTEASVGIMAVGASSVRIIPVTERTYAYWAPDSASIAILMSSSLQIVTALGEPLLTFSETGALPFGWSHDGAHFAFGECDGNLAVATLGASELVRLDTTTCWARWSPTEARLGYSADGGIRVWSADDGTSMTVAPISDDWSWSWSPDGTMLAAFDQTSGETLLIDSHDGAELGRVPGIVTWNATGTRLFSLNSNPDTGRLGALTASGKGGELRELSDLVAAVAWLPDGDHLAVIALSEAFTIHADGSERTRVATVGGPNATFGWVTPQSSCPGCWPR